MILDSLDSSTLYSDINPLFKKSFDFLKKTDFTKLELGKHVLEGDDLFLIYMEYESKEPSECKMENHKKYIDIQYMLTGEELIGISTFHDQVATVPYDEKTDVAFYKNEYTTLLKLEQGHFAIFFPQDLHMPCMRTTTAVQVKKAVFKIKVT
jgi:YhcH/YjgK/YiaL family protein